MTNTAIGAVDAGGLLPLGIVTHRFGCGNGYENASTFVPATAGANTITINEKGYYKVTYTGTVVTTAEGTVTETLFLNGEAITGATISVTPVTAGDPVGIALSYVFKLNCGDVPSNLQIVNAGGALASGFGNLIVEKL